MAGSGALAHPSLGALPPEAGAAQRAVAAPTHSAPAQAGATCRPRWQGCYLHALARARVRALSAAHLVRRQVEKTKPVVPLAADMRWAGERRALRCRDVAKSLRQPIAVCVWANWRTDRFGSASFELYTCSVSSTHARTLLTSSGQPAYTRAAAEQLVGVTKRVGTRGSIQCVAVSDARLCSYARAVELRIGVSR